MWDVYLSPDVQQFLDKLDSQLADRIKKGLEKLKCDNPFHFLEHFESKNYYKFRVGDYRALVDVDFTKRMIIVHILDNRGVIYKRK